MRRFRTQWLALFGALVILGLSLSTAFGARPTGTDEEGAPNFGQQVSAFVHALQDSDEECETEEDTDEDTDEDSECDSDEDSDEDTDEDTDEDEDADEDSDEESEDESGAAANSHGKCVVEVARSEDVGEPNDNHGGAVSFAARVTCRALEFADEGADTGDEDSDEDSDEEVSDEDASASEKTRGKSAEAHQRKLDRGGSGKPSWAGAKSHGGGHGHGKGGNH